MQCAFARLSLRLAALGLSLALFLPLGAGAQPSPALKHAPAEAPTRVLFVGNSLVYYNNGLSTHVHRMISAANPALESTVKSSYKSVHITGATLDQYPLEHFLKPGILNVKEPFQLVVLAGNSTDASGEAQRDRYRKKVLEFDALIKRAGSHTALYWLPAPVKPHPLAETGMTQKNADMLLSVGNEIGALVIPVGPAFDEAYRRRPGIKLQTEYDGNHPTLAGTYLSAAVVYGSLYGKPSKGNTYDYFGRVDKETAAFLQQVADDTVNAFYGR
ncbi:hypothetical protein PIGHUM_02579 [Pigmentiphaga humi]|uniref:SGNH hydrolase-type esterase domain-containing protein n=1 Tax=Pigmentiphaga humi TaxID=2478468 RepID=A0A3P4B2J5_9BURK|nr:hypothetical protein [Pigmentiphaga humi]VCU70507.1 hypothetical protein PIGHUM_02579 [Pigmentiphaga humi]